MHDYEKQHYELLRRNAPECMVLLKNRGDFPLSGPGEIALYGSGARHTVKGGTGSGDVNSRFFITVEQGLQNAGFTVTTGAWLDAYDKVCAAAHERFLEEIRREAKEKHTMPILLGMGRAMPEPNYALPLDGRGDTALYVLSRNSGEGNDRRSIPGDVLLTETEIRDILALQEKYAHFMLVLNVGGPVDLTPVAAAENILILSQLGTVTGDALADVLLGRSYPSGKLTTTWAAWPDYPMIGGFGGEDDTDYREGIYVGYRYFDTVGKAAAYPFGFGLGYTSFALGAAELSAEGTGITVRVPVSNTGRFPGRDTVQLYASLPEGRLDRPYQTLAAFAKTGELKPGESETVTLRFGMEELASYDEKAAAWVLEAGRTILRLGTSSRDTSVCGAVDLKEGVTVRKVTRVGGVPGFADWKPETRAHEDAENVPAVTISPAAFAALKWPEPAAPSERARKKAATLSAEELIGLCIGKFSGGFTSVIGSASTHVAGAAGESIESVDGVPALVMADGPAGLRLAQKYTKDEKGCHALGSTMPAGFEELFSPAQRWFMQKLEKKPKGEIFEQYCTAIPIGTALAQSWNPALAELCGELVAEEMEHFGVHLWLAPAMNIHRSILCGRNFEYLSEDPLLSGKIAAGITRGVQKHPGCGVTIKHFFCNNQETNRYQTSSNLSERALREIYLRGFAICIREGDPVALMTSYNLVNGVHTSERRDVLKTVLREEWGWRGLVMTDWIVSMIGKRGGKYRMAKSAPSIAAGNSLFMPGSPGDYRMALSAMQGKGGKHMLTRGEAETCAAYVMDTAWRLTEHKEENR